jgi:hydrogenase maturation protease
VIGYGNSLRGDDGVGLRVAAVVARWKAPGLQTLEVHQLAPELAETLAGVGRAIFVDAYTAPAGGTVLVEALAPADFQPSLGHTCDPRLLLALARALYGRHPEAWLVAVPGYDFEPGETLSAETARGMNAALRQIASLIAIPAADRRTGLHRALPSPFR